jgi:sugar phosphate isomerase/epimerase
MILSMTTDYAADTGDPAPYLRRIADAGFTHVHWCHHWNTDFQYSLPEMKQLERWLSDFGLRLLNVHGSDGREKRWCSDQEYRRQAGVELVLNRLELAARLGGDVVIMHAVQDSLGATQPFQEVLRRTLDEIEPVARSLGVRLALENLNEPDHWQLVERVFEAYAPDFVGLCYDSGHGNLGEDGLSQLQQLKDRLIAVHLHDNDGTADQHLIPFAGTVDWDRLAHILAVSAYTGPVNIETGMRGTGINTEHDFLTCTFAAACRVGELIGSIRGTVDGDENSRP